MDPRTLGLITTIVLFAAIGWLMARRARQPAPWWAFALLLVAAIVGRYLGIGSRLLDAQGFAIPINWAIVACCAGAGAGLLWRNRQLKRLAAS
jgi:hypothetical protein